MPVSDAEVSETALFVATVLLVYCATNPARATFDGLFASPPGTLSSDRALLSVMVLDVVRSYIFVEATINEPSMVSGRCVMLAVNVGEVSE